MKCVLLFAFLVVGVVSPRMAAAQAGRTHDPKIWLGGSLGLSPIGKLKSESGDLKTSTDTAVAFGIGGLVEFQLTPNISLGFAPNLILNVKGTDADDSGTQLDLPLRLAAGAPVTPKIRVYGFVAPGYSVLFPPDSAPVDVGHTSGFMIGFGGGAGFRVAPKLMVTAELGYQFRFLSGTTEIALGDIIFEVDTSIDINYLTFALGVVAALD